MLFNLACYGIVTVLAGGFWNGGLGWHWAIFAVTGFALFAATLRRIMQSGLVARIEGREIETQGPFGQSYVFNADSLVEANLDPGRRIGVLAYTDEASGEKTYAPISFRLMGAEAAKQFVVEIEALRPGLPAITSATRR